MPLSISRALLKVSGTFDLAYQRKLELGRLVCCLPSKAASIFGKNNVIILKGCFKLRRGCGKEVFVINIKTFTLVGLHKCGAS